MSNEHTTQIIDIISKIDTAMVLNQAANIEDLKLLLLIIYNECFCNEEKLDPVLKSFLTVTLNRFISLENAAQSQPTEEINDIMPNCEDDEGMKAAILNEHIIRQLIHSRAPQLMEKE